MIHSILLVQFTFLTVFAQLFFGIPVGLEPFTSYSIHFFTHTHTHTHTTVLLLFWNLSGTTWVSRYQKGKNQEGKTNLDLLEKR